MDCRLVRNWLISTHEWENLAQNYEFLKGTYSMMMFVQKLSQKFVREESGADMVEYALVLALVAIVASVALKTLGNAVQDAFTNIQTQITGVL
jgi:pilus assembly protein Flp/PilA